MLLILLAGAWALLIGRISITPRIHLRGKYARLYGLALLLSLFPLPFLLFLVGMVGIFLGLDVQALEQQNVAFTIIDWVLCAGITVGLAYPFQRWQDNSGESAADVPAHLVSFRGIALALAFVVIAAILGSELVLRHIVKEVDEENTRKQVEDIKSE